MPSSPTTTFFNSLIAELRPWLLGIEGDGSLRDLHLGSGTATVVVEAGTGGVDVTWLATEKPDEADLTFEQALANVLTEHSAKKAAAQVSRLLVGLCSHDGAAGER